MLTISFVNNFMGEGLYQLASTDVIYYSHLDVSYNEVPFRCPEGATTISTWTDDRKTADTWVFVAAQDALFYKHKSIGFREIIKNPILSGVKKLYSHHSNKHVTIFGLNKNGDVFYSRCELNSWSHPNSWSYPIPLLTGVTEISAFINTKTNSSVIIAHAEGSHIIQLMQDPVTTHWHERSFILPSPSDVAEYNSYTSHFQLTKDNGLPLGGEELSITSTSPCSVYINDIYHRLVPDSLTDIKTDLTGTVTIVQEVHELAAVCYHLKLKGADEKSLDVNPMKKMIDTISSIKSGDDLGNINIPDGKGGTTSLVPPSVMAKEKDNATKFLQGLVSVGSKMPVDGSMRIDQALVERENSASLSRFSANYDAMWGLSFENGKCSYHEDADAVRQIVQQTDETSSVHAGVDDHWLEVTAGDVWRWAKHAYAEVKNFFVQVIDGVHQFIISIGGKILQFIIKCVGDVMHAAELAFKMIKVCFEDLVKWLGFLFEWDDILRTQGVLKNIIRQFLRHSVEQVHHFKKVVAEAFQNAENQIASWAHWKSVKESMGEISRKTERPAGADSPQVHWGTHHMSHNARTSSISTDVSPNTSGVDIILRKLADMIKNEGDAFQKAYDTIKNHIIDQIDELSVGEIAKRLLAVLVSFLAASIKNIVEASLDVLAFLLDGVVKILDASVEVPVISWMYSKISHGEKLTVLGALCLIVAIPSTILFKIAKNRAPYPNNSDTNQIIHADSWTALKSLFQNADANFSAVTAGTTLAGVTADVLHLVSYYSAPLFAALSIAKAEGSNRVVSILHGCSFFTTTAPAICASLLSSPNQTPSRVFGEVIYGLTVLQKLADIFTYQEDTFMGTEWPSTLI